MRTEWRIFGAVAAFLFAMSGLYAWWSSYGLTKIDVIGTVALLLSGVLCLMCGGYFWFVSRRIDPRPEDRPDAEVSEGAGEVGFFSPGSYWPFGIGLATVVTGLGVVFWMWWLIVAGLIAILLSTSALLFEYYTGTRRTAEH